MTTQCADLCLIDGAERLLWPSPLEPVIAALRLAPKYSGVRINSACRRGYTANWELRDGALYLLAVDGLDGDGVRLEFATFEDLGMHGWEAEVVALHADPSGLVNPLPEACMMHVKDWLAGDRLTPLRVDWMIDPVGLTRGLVAASMQLQCDVVQR